MQSVFVQEASVFVMGDRRTMFMTFRLLKFSKVALPLNQIIVSVGWLPRGWFHLFIHHSETFRNYSSILRIFHSCIRLSFNDYRNWSNQPLVFNDSLWCRIRDSTRLHWLYRWLFGDNLVLITMIKLKITVTKPSFFWYERCQRQLSFWWSLSHTSTAAVHKNLF